jgi:hypothetical protein
LVLETENDSKEQFLVRLTFAQSNKPRLHWRVRAQDHAQSSANLQLPYASAGKKGERPYRAKNLFKSSDKLGVDGVGVGHNLLNFQS